MPQLCASLLASWLFQIPELKNRKEKEGKTYTYVNKDNNINLLTELNASLAERRRKVSEEISCIKSAAFKSSQFDFAALELFFDEVSFFMFAGRFSAEKIETK